jgi:hypothetical protein
MPEGAQRLLSIVTRYRERKGVEGERFTAPKHVVQPLTYKIHFYQQRFHPRATLKHLYVFNSFIFQTYMP